MELIVLWRETSDKGGKETIYVDLEASMTSASVENLAGVRVFVEVARLGNFTKAAEHIGISKSAVGKTIARLEARLGLQLFQRTTRSNRLTREGEQYYSACQAALESIAAAERDLKVGNAALTGSVRLDMPVVFGREKIMPVLLEMCEPHPGLDLTMTFSEGFTDPAKSDVDLLVRFGALEDSSHLISRRLAVEPRLICASPGYLERMGIPNSPRDLNRHRGLIGTAGGPPRKWTIREGGVIKSVAPGHNHHFSDGSAIVEAAVAGFGLCQMPQSIVSRFLVSGALRPVLEKYSDVPVEIHLLWPHQSYQSARHRYLIDGIVAWSLRGLELPSGQSGVGKHG